MRILVAEDDPVSMGFLELSLSKWGYTIEAVNNGEAALEALTRPDAPKLAILDWMMPKMDGIEVCRAIRGNADNELEYTYIIMLTVKSSLFDMVDGIASGADDYIIKPFIPQDLKARLDAGKRIVELQEKLLQSRKTLISSSSSDLGTRTWNREKILSIISAELNRSKRKDRSQSLAMIKIDNYTGLLKNLGAKAVDDFLCNSMNQIQTTVRSYDSIGRYSDDEFLILFPETVHDEMPAIIDRIFNTVKCIETTRNGIGFPLSITVGVVTCRGDITEEKLISEANVSISKAIQDGLRRVHFSIVE